MSSKYCQSTELLSISNNFGKNNVHIICLPRTGRLRACSGHRSCRQWEPWRCSPIHQLHLSLAHCVKEPSTESSRLSRTLQTFHQTSTFTVSLNKCPLGFLQ